MKSGFPCSEVLHVSEQIKGWQKYLFLNKNSIKYITLIIITKIESLRPTLHARYDPKVGFDILLLTESVCRMYYLVESH